MSDLSSWRIKPQYSEILSRKDVDTTSYLSPLKLETPVILANMDTVSSAETCIETWKAGAIGALHRFMSIEENVEEYKKVLDAGANCFVSIGVSEEDKIRLRKLYLELTSKLHCESFYICLDVAHADHILVKNMLLWIKNYAYDDNTFILAGNVGTPEAVRRLKQWGADFVKVNIGGGSVCSTKLTAGVEASSLSEFMECVKVAKQVNVPLVFDGGMQNAGDVAKAIGAGAAAVMTGKLFSTVKTKPLKGLYRGSASSAVVKKRNGDDTYVPAPEGMEIAVKEEDKTIKEVVDYIKGGLQSAMSYSNARTIFEFQTFVKLVKNE